ncbi:WD40 repeat domain-containing protein [Streptomyces pseudovenezuelae]|uniref:WD40 repeat domain-containing protein n=1 Tax=Streptomyces pseudovenezuelae TaxID=67350 RepID=UPI002476833F|nr:hypothetical protein [Streptomyces pseudovenezuelae]
MAIARKVAADAAEVRRHNPALAAQLNLAAYRLADTVDVRDQLMSTVTTTYTSRLTGHTSDVVSISFAPRSTVLATVSWDRTVRLWDVGNAHRPVQLAVLHEPLRLLSVAFGRGGSVLAAASEGSVRLWDVRGGAAAAVLAGHSNPVPAVAFGPHGDTLATGGNDFTIRLSDTPAWIGSPLESATAPTRGSPERNGHGTSRRRTTTRPAPPHDHGK